MTAARENGWRSGWRVARFYPDRYVGGGILWAFVAFLPLLPGLLLKLAFDRVESDSSRSALGVLAVLAAAELTRSSILYAAIMAWQRWWRTVATWLRGNLLRAVLLGDGPPARRLPGTPGEAVGRFRDEVDDVIWLADGWVDLAGAIVLGVVGVAIMAAIDPFLTLVAVTPLVGIVFITRLLGNRVRKIHRSLRQSGATVTAFVADMFSNAQTLKTSGAEDRAVARFHALNVTRGGAAVTAHVTNMFVYNVGVGAASISTGLVLLLAASAMRRNEFSVGDLALFTSYASSLTFLPRRTGETIARARSAGVATERLARFAPDEGADAVFAPASVDVTRRAAPAPAVVANPADALRRLTVRGLTASPALGRRGIVEVNLEIEAGEFVVVTGVVGAGKTTLL
ncbi:MAG: ABC transporter ATP-binding protein, partial [Acidimicrobiales bacterium]|nr:ABC transporter ATP-binding protein [Acidimicrobiales bacterium]